MTKMVTFIKVWSSWFYSIPTRCNQTEAEQNNSLVAFITVIGNREHDQDGDSVLKVYSIVESKLVKAWPLLSL